jgi:hypothetical protein
MTLLLSKWKGQAFTRWIFWAKVDPHVVQVWGRFLARPVFVSPYRDPKKTFRTNFKNNKWRNNNPNNVKTPYDQQHKPFNYIFKKKSVKLPLPPCPSCWSCCCWGCCCWTWIWSCWVWCCCWCCCGCWWRI